jgi:signal transduction histidine kinase/ligand-binding sensor domain-containing protein
MLLASSPLALALDPALDLSQYAHAAWKIRDGFSRGPINAVAQTSDGYLWLAADLGISRFDGVRNVPWQPPPGQQLPSALTISLLATRDGSLWMGTDKGPVRWKDGQLKRFDDLADQFVISLLEDHEGSVWMGSVSASAGRLCVFRHDSLRCFGQDGSLGRGVVSLHEYAGSVWAATLAGLWRWTPDPPKLYPVPAHSPQISTLIGGDNGALWLGMGDGIKQLVHEKIETYPLGGPKSFHPYRFLRDRDGGLWIGTTGQGLVHSHRGRVDVFTSVDGLSGDTVRSLFEDREGAVWVTTDEGLDRFRNFAVPTITRKQGLSDGAVSSLVAAKDGTVWIGTGTGLNQWRDGVITIYRKPGGRLLPSPVGQPEARVIHSDRLPENVIESLFQDDRGRVWISTLRGVVYAEDGRFAATPVMHERMTARSIAGDSRGNLWIADLDLGLLRLFPTGAMQQLSWAKLGRRDFGVRLAADPVKGGLWIGFFEGGVGYLKDGAVVASFAEAEGLAGGRVNDLRLDPGGALWVATEGGLSRLKSGRIGTLTNENGLPCQSVHWAVEDNDRSLWLSTTCGLMRVSRPDVEAWVANPKHHITPAVFDTSDGVVSAYWSAAFSPEAVKSQDGRIWFMTLGGVGVIDPGHLSLNKLPPPVHIEGIVANHKPYELRDGLRLPPLIRDLQIDYTALSLIAPEKVRFRYKLEGKDIDWRDAGDRRQAFYNDLAPRRYRFRVIACNNSGVWNEAGASFDFFIEPAYYQTILFRLLCGAAFLGLLGGFFYWRLREVEQHFNLRLEARVHERTRIARELHDTLLQSFQGVLMKFDAAAGIVQNRSAEAEQILDTAVEQARKAIAEGRDAVQGLRSSTVVANDLPEALGTLGEELAGHYGGSNGPTFSLHVEGDSRDLAPLVRDEIHRVAAEALRNAFRHAEASRIEVELRYDKRHFRLRVKDNGKGIDQAVLNDAGRDKHFGLPGMQERAKVAGGKLAVFSRPGAGTEVELMIPASFVYRKSADTPPPSSSGTGA